VELRARVSLPRAVSRGAPLEQRLAPEPPDVRGEPQAAVGSDAAAQPPVVGSARGVQAQPPAAAERGVPARPPVARAEWDVRVLRPAASVAQARLRVAQAASDVPVRPRAAESAVLAQQAERGEVRRPAAPTDAARLRVASAARDRPARAAASAFHPGRVLPSAPARRRAVRFARAMLKRRTASPSAQSWQAARDEAVS
jgi:hypothetical protein